jgi:iron complex transport system substrate-binding protein
MSNSKNSRHLFSFNKPLLLTLILLIFGYSSPAAQGDRETQEIGRSPVITDMRGRSVSIPEEINGIVALGAGSLRLLTYLDAVDKVIAVEDQGHGREKSAYDFFSLATYRLAFPGLRDLPSIGGAENHEGIIAAAPDIIISSTIDTGALDQLQAVLGIPVFAVDVDVELKDTERFYHQLATLGKVLDKNERAEDLIEGIRAILADLEDRAAKVTQLKRAYAGGMMYYGPADLLRTTGDYLPFDLTGTENVMPTNPAGNLQPYMTSLEDLAAAAPDFVFIDAANAGLSRSGFMANRAVLEAQVPAFANREVYTTLVYKYYGTNWDNHLINIYFAGKVLYPGLYTDVSIEDKSEEIWRLFFGVSLDYPSVIGLQKTGPGRADWF